MTTEEKFVIKIDQLYSSEYRDKIIDFYESLKIKPKIFYFEQKGGEWTSMPFGIPKDMQNKILCCNCGNANCSNQEIKGRPYKNSEFSVFISDLNFKTAKPDRWSAL